MTRKPPAPYTGGGASQSGATGLGRRDVLKFMGASLALGGLTGCEPAPHPHAIPSVRDHPERLPGTTQSYATTVTLNGTGRGVLVTTQSGRPVKIEGNPEHPASRGATDIFAQADILGLYDPDRSATVLEDGEPSTWTRLREALASRGVRAPEGGAGTLRVLTGPVTSPSLAHTIGQVLSAHPGARWHVHDPLDSPGARRGATYAFGRPVDVAPRMADADVLLSLDADILGPGPAQIAHAADFAARRQLDGQDGMMRLYTVESALSLTGAAADHRAALSPHGIERFTRALVSALDLTEAAPNPPGAPWFPELVADLNANRERALVVAGSGQPPFVHAAAHALNAALGDLAPPIAPVASGPVPADTLDSLIEDIATGAVDTLVILDCNPVHTAPGDLDVAAALRAVPFTLHLGLHADETAAACRWHAPMTHELESWGDARAFDGTVGLRQPLIRPMVEAASPRAVLAMLGGEESQRDDRDALRAYWEAHWPNGDRSGNGDHFEHAWRRALHDGVVAGTAETPLDLPLREDWADAPGFADHEPDTGDVTGNRLRVVLRPHPSILDGRYANNAWLQELPDPLTKLTWDNVALISPATAARLGVENGTILRLDDGLHEVLAPAWRQPGQAEGCVTLHLGYGRKRAGRLGTGVGFDAYPLRRRDALWVSAPLAVSVTAQRAALAFTQPADAARDPDHMRVATLAQFLREPDFAADPDENLPSIYPDYAYPDHAWGMSIDLNACIGCNACVVACQAENNTAVVGKDEVLRAREMHWLRIDRAYDGLPDDPRVTFQPMLCMHCEKAPCEPVCPVNATVHGSEGLNEMVYNRCIGTRYCSNNCPYKVRRFNWRDYAAGETARPAPANNPNVTVRSRGVMEKCTFCVQRINAARIDARRGDGAIPDGSLQTACQQACPTRAIVFGDLNDPDSAVAARKRDSRDYGLLARLNTRPRTTYLARIVNTAPGQGEGEE